MTAKQTTTEPGNESFWQWFVNLDRRDRLAFVTIAIVVVVGNLVNIIYAIQRFVDAHADPATQVTLTPNDDFVDFGLMICDQKEVFRHWNPADVEDDDVFLCSSTGLRIPAIFVCNGVSECENGEDEAESLCTDFSYADCFDDEFPCGNGQCIPSEFKCDQVPDCIDESDEQGCARSDFCGSSEFACAGDCFPIEFVCDGEVDCLDGSDEIDCGGDGCSDSHFTCPASGQCIPADYECDCVLDCADSTGEAPDFSDEHDDCVYDGVCCSREFYNCGQDCEFDELQTDESCNGANPDAFTCWQSNPNGGGGDPPQVFLDYFACETGTAFDEAKLLAMNSSRNVGTKSSKTKKLSVSSPKLLQTTQVNSQYFHNFRCTSSLGNGKVFHEKNCGRPYQVPFGNSENSTLFCAYATDPAASEAGPFSVHQLRREWVIQSDNKPSKGNQPLFVIPFYIRSGSGIHEAVLETFGSDSTKLAGATSNVLYGSQVSLKMGKERLTDLAGVDTIRIIAEPSFDQLVDNKTVTLRVTGAVVDFTETHIAEVSQFGVTELMSALMSVLNFSLSIYVLLFPTVALIKTQRFFKFSKNKPELLDPREYEKVVNKIEEIEMGDVEVAKGDDANYPRLSRSHLQPSATTTSANEPSTSLKPAATISKSS